MSSTHYLSRMFGSSPVPTIELHMTTVASCAAELPAVFEALVAGDSDRIQKGWETICKLEHDADNIKRQIRLHLPNSLFMPVSRADLLAMVSVQDHVANLAQDVAGILAGRPVSIPADVGAGLLMLVTKAVETTAQANKSVGELSELFQSGFRGVEVTEVADMLERLDELEAEADELEIQVRRTVYQAEKDLAPIDAYFLYRIIDLIGELGDEAQRIGARLLLLLAR